MSHPQWKVTLPETVHPCCAGEPAREFDPIVIVEDSATSAALVRQVLGEMRLVNPVVHVDDGDRAVEWFERTSRSGERPALVLLDVVLPGRDGMDVLRWLRSRDDLRSVPVVVLTATARRDDIEEVYERLGADSYLVKPVGFDALGDVLRDLPLCWALMPATDDA
jgi:CheY-like chemotaxis protein